MRLSVLPNISTKDGTSNKNARLTNMLKVSGVRDIAEIRPGLVLSDSYVGLGNGLIPFDGRLLVIYDDTVTDTEEDTLPWPLNSDTWGVAVIYDYNDTVWYNGGLYFSQSAGNTGNTPGSSTAWGRASTTNNYDPIESYNIGDSVIANGVTYYSLTPSNTGKTPSSSPYNWSTTPTTSARYQGYINIPGTGAGNPGPECATIESAANAAWAQATSGYSCATKDVIFGTYSWRTFSHVVGSLIYLTQWNDSPPYDCSGTANQLSTVNIGTVSQTA